MLLFNPHVAIAKKNGLERYTQISNTLMNFAHPRPISAACYLRMLTMRRCFQTGMCKALTIFWTFLCVF